MSVADQAATHAAPVGLGVGVGLAVGEDVGTGVVLPPQAPWDVQGWPVPDAPLFVTGSSPRVHQFAR